MAVPLEQGDRSCHYYSAGLNVLTSQNVFTISCLGEHECRMFKMPVSSGSHFRAFCDVKKEEWFDAEQSGGN